MNETESPVIDDTVAEAADSQLDRDDRLKPAFVDAVLAAVQDGDTETAHDLVAPLHPADIADLFELTPEDRRKELAAAISDLVDADVFAELNDYVREDLIDALDARQVADIASELDTDDAVAIMAAALHPDLELVGVQPVPRGVREGGRGVRGVRRVADAPRGPADMADEARIDAKAAA